MVVWNQDWKKPVYGPKYLVFKWTTKSCDYHLNTSQPYCLVFRWIRYSGVWHSDGYWTGLVPYSDTLYLHLVWFNLRGFCLWWSCNTEWLGLDCARWICQEDQQLLLEPSLTHPWTNAEERFKMFVNFVFFSVSLILGNGKVSKFAPLNIACWCHLIKNNMLYVAVL